MLQVTNYLGDVVTDDDVVVAQVPLNEPQVYYLWTQHLHVPVRTWLGDGLKRAPAIRESRLCANGL